MEPSPDRPEARLSGSAAQDKVALVHPCTSRSLSPQQGAPAELIPLEAELQLCFHTHSTLGAPRILQSSMQTHLGACWAVGYRGVWS